VFIAGITEIPANQVRLHRELDGLVSQMNKEERFENGGSQIRCFREARIWGIIEVLHLCYGQKARLTERALVQNPLNLMNQ
jgi:hypothetical protein